MLENIHSPEDIKKLTQSQISDLADEIRQTILKTVGKNGGHLASNLGVVELTLALHRVFDSPTDAIIWDVSHQCYPHKLLTGRYDKFGSLRQKGGIAGFTRHEESPHDIFDSGHSSTSISSALGLLTGRKLLNKEGKVIAVIGDGALTGGMAFEALSHAGQIAKNLVVILNDNQQSIGKNTGSLSRYLSRLSMTVSYQNFRYRFDRMIDKIPLINRHLSKFIFRFKRGLKGMLLTNNLFVDLGFEYVGPLDGHDEASLEKILKRIKKINRPVVVHVQTRKGKGYPPAEKEPEKYHGIGPFNIESGEAINNSENPNPTFTRVFSDTMVKIGQKYSDVAAITAAMASGTGLDRFAKLYPERFFDVGIAEQHAVTFAGGLSVAGIKPVVAIYSTFMQRGIDQLIQDIAIQQIPAVFALDRSGAVPDDGETHQGIFDISLLRPVPNMTLLAPATKSELEQSLEWAVKQNLPVVIRYPKGKCPKDRIEFSEELVTGRGILIKNELRKKSELLFVCTGGIYPEVQETVNRLKEMQIPCDIYNLRFLKPLDKKYFLDVVSNYSKIIFVEDGIRIGGIGTYLESLLQRTFEGKKTAVCGFHDKFISQGKRVDILDEAHLTPEWLLKKVASI